MNRPSDNLFEKFLKASTCKSTLQTFRFLCKEIDLEYPPKREAGLDNHISFYPKLKQALCCHWKARSLFSKLDKKYNDKSNLACLSEDFLDQQVRVAKDLNVLIVGAGPCGLRTAIFTALLGAKTVVVEKRDSFSRNNVLHLWPFTIEDLRGLGAKVFNGQFCSGAVDHVSIRQLQLILMKCALIFGVEICVNTAFMDVVPPNVEGVNVWKAKFDPETSPLNNFGFNVIIGADGRKNTLRGFEKKTFRGSLAIGITVNFINKRTKAEAEVPEICGINFIYRQEFFRRLNMIHGIDLENIVYYKDDTHYFVMTARKRSLLERKVLKEKYDDPKKLLHMSNIDQDALYHYTLDAANFATENGLPNLEAAINNYGLPDIALFDFTCMRSSANASMFREVNGVKLLQALVGDSLLEPFWPKGTGIAKGFLAAYDTSWMIRQWALGRLKHKTADRSLEMSLLAERESLYRILAQIENNNLVQKYSLFSLDPKSRYQYTGPRVSIGQVQSFYVSDGKGSAWIPDQEKRDFEDDGEASKHTQNFVKSEKLQQWCEKVLRDSGSNVHITNMSSSWKDGRALCSIINYYRPDILNLNELIDGNAEFNNQLAFDIAEEHLGVVPILSGKEMAECEIDGLVMVAYLSQFYEIFKDETPGMDVSTDFSAGSSDLLRSASKTMISLAMLAKLKQQFKRNRLEDEPTDLSACIRNGKMTSLSDNEEATRGFDDSVAKKPRDYKDAANGISSSGQPWMPQLQHQSDSPSLDHQHTLSSRKASNSNICHSCGKDVYVVERLGIEGLFFHRRCFKCIQCGTILRPLNYKRDSDTGKFYCDVHYFANAQYLKQKFGDDEKQITGKVESDFAEPHEEDTANTSSTSRSSKLSARGKNLNEQIFEPKLTPYASHRSEIEEEALIDYNMTYSRNSEPLGLFCDFSSDSDGHSSDSSCNEDMVDGNTFESINSMRDDQLASHSSETENEKNDLGSIKGRQQFHGSNGHEYQNAEQTETALESFLGNTKNTLDGDTCGQKYPIPKPRTVFKSTEITERHNSRRLDDSSSDCLASKSQYRTSGLESNRKKPENAQNLQSLSPKKSEKLPKISQKEQSHLHLPGSFSVEGSRSSRTVDNARRGYDAVKAQAKSCHDGTTQSMGSKKINPQLSRKRDLRTYSAEEVANRMSRRVQLAAKKEERQTERKRMERALDIQNEMEEIDMERRHLEQRGVELEISLRSLKAKNARPVDEGALISEWMNVVQKRNALKQKEDKLLFQQAHLQSEDELFRLRQRVERSLTEAESGKSNMGEKEINDLLDEMKSKEEQTQQLALVLDGYEDHKSDSRIPELERRLSRLNSNS